MLLSTVAIGMTAAPVGAEVESADRTLETTEAEPGEEVDVEVSIDVGSEGERFSHEDFFEPDLGDDDNVDIGMTHYNGEFISPETAFGVSDGTLVAFEENFEDGDTITVRYTVTIPEDATPGETFTFQGKTGIDDQDDIEVTGDDQITVAGDPPHFEVSGLDPMDVTVEQGKEIDVSATVNNTGDAEDTQEVEYRVGDDVIASQEVTLDEGDQTTVEFDNIEIEDLDAGEYKHGVFSDDANQTATLTVEEAPDPDPDPAEFEVSDIEPDEATVTQEDLITVSANVTNTGDETATQDVELRIRDGSIDEKFANATVTLDPGEERTVEFSDIDIHTLMVGDYEHVVASEDDEAVGLLEIRDEVDPEPAEFAVSDLDPTDVTVEQGEEMNVSATIMNTGDEEEIQTVEFQLDGDVVASEDVTLEGGESTTVEFENLSTGDLEAGEYQHGVFTDDDSQTATLTIEEPVPDPDPAEFAVSDLDPVNATVEQNETFTVSATVTNVGDEEDTQTVEFRIEGDVIASDDVTLEGGESTVVEFEDIGVDDLETGDYEHGVFTDDDNQTGTLTVEEEDPFLDTDDQSGFGGVVALAALLSIALLARRR